VSDFRSKVTLRPRSRLEKLLDLLAPDDVERTPTPEYAVATGRSQSVVAPSADAARVAVRLGYPGNEVAAVARALDAEVPEGDATAVAFRAHRELHLHGISICLRTAPGCDACRLRASCSYHGEGPDPAQRLEPKAPPSEG
jgi:hypothetical protein